MARVRIWPDDGDVCSVFSCGIGFDDLGYLIDITVLTSPGEEGYAEITQWFCQEHYEQIAPKLMALGFKSHNHHGTNLLDASDDCGGYGKCPHAVEYGPELVVPTEPTKEQLDAKVYAAYERMMQSETAHRNAVNEYHAAMDESTSIKMRGVHDD